jgi:hypothetical protein
MLMLSVTRDKELIRPRSTARTCSADNRVIAAAHLHARAKLG